MKKILSISGERKLSNSLKYRDSLESSRLSVKRKNLEYLDKENSSFIKRLISVKSTINTKRNN